MAKLYFKYGVVNSSKSANALMTIHNYEEQGMKVYIIKPKIDTRDNHSVKSRAINTSRVADAFIGQDDNLYDILANHSSFYDVVIVDECQFLTSKQVDQLRGIVDDLNVPVLCYGLRTDFATNMFEGSKRLFELADSISEIKTICKCGSKAIFNGRFDENGKKISEGEQVVVGGNEMYKPLCSKCYYSC